MGCDNDLLHLLQLWQPRASVCVWSVDAFSLFQEKLEHEQ